MSFSIFVPTIENTTRPRIRIPAEVPRTAPQVLVVEADEAVRRVICRALRAAGIIAHEASSAAQVRSVVAMVRPDVVVLNAGRLDETTGLQIGEWLRLNDPTMKLICIGGAPEMAAFVGPPHTHLTRILHKPFGARVIVGHIFGMLSLAGGLPPAN